MTIRTTLLASAVFVCSVTFASAATLSSLIGGGSIAEGDVVFDNFAFSDFFDDVRNSPFDGDRVVSADEIEISTSAAAGSVSLTATINPAIGIAGIDPTSGLDHLFEFFLDFSVYVAAPSSRQIIGATLGGGNLFATGDGVSEVIYDILGNLVSNELEIFEAPEFAPASATTDFEAFAATSLLMFEGQIEGNTGSGGTAGLSTFTMTFDLQGEPPEPSVVPVPASLPLLVTALSIVGFVRRWRSPT